MNRWVAAALLTAGFTAIPASAYDVLPGPVDAVVLQVIDGDTIDVRAQIWLRQAIETRVRLLGVDAPELRGKCDAEQRMAEAARDFVRARLAAGSVVLRELRFDKYGGRVLARVETADGEDLARALLAAGLARSYDGGRRRPWCDGRD